MCGGNHKNQNVAVNGQVIDSLNLILTKGPEQMVHNSDTFMMTFKFELISTFCLNTAILILTELGTCLYAMQSFRVVRDFIRGDFSL